MKTLGDFVTLQFDQRAIRSSKPLFDEIQNQ